MTWVSCDVNPCQTNDCSNPYVLETELSAGSHGNDWGRACADSGGFRDAVERLHCAADGSLSCAADADCAAVGGGCILATDSPTPLITDSQPLCTL